MAAATARRLFEEGSAQDVAAALESQYPACIAAMSTPKNDLAALDAFWRTELPATLRAREDKDGGAYVTKAELTRIMRWKITRGKSRPLLHLIESNDDANIRRVSREAFAALGGGAAGSEEARVRRAIETMSAKSVKGVGPATASAVLAAYRGDLVPFMADEAVAAAVPSIGKLGYTINELMAFRDALVARAMSLGGGVTAEALGQALWALAKAKGLGIGSGDAGKKKRPAPAAGDGDAGAAATKPPAKQQKKGKK